MVNIPTSKLFMTTSFALPFGRYMGVLVQGQVFIPNNDRWRKILANASKFFF